jgi:zinc protease
VSILVKASPRDEEPERAGLAYLTAKLLADGTATRKGPEISEAIEFLGASFGTTVTSDFTLLSYSSLKKDAASGLALVSDVLQNPVFAEDEVARKKAVTRGALQQKEEDPQHVAGKRFLKEVYGQHPYGRQVEGDPAAITAITRNDIQDFYARTYRPDNTVMAMVGDISPAEARQLAERYFGGWAARTDRPAPASTLSVQQPEKKRVILNRDVTQASIVFGHDGIARSHTDYYAVQVMNYILGGGGFASRLMQIVRDEMGLAYSISSMFNAGKTAGSFNVDVQTKNASAATVVAEIERQMARMRAEAISDNELSDAKAYLTGSFPRRFETSKKIVDFLVVADFYELGADYVEKYPSYINRVTKDDVLRVARTHLHPDRAILVIVGNEAEMKLPDAQTLK